MRSFIALALLALVGCAEPEGPATVPTPPTPPAPTYTCAGLDVAMVSGSAIAGGGGPNSDTRLFVDGYPATGGTITKPNEIDYTTVGQNCITALGGSTDQVYWPSPIDIVDGTTETGVVALGSVIGPVSELCIFAVASDDHPLCTVSPTDTLCSVIVTVTRTGTATGAAQCETVTGYTLTVPAIQVSK